MAPALLLLVFTTVQVGLWFHGRNVALQAAREGVSQLRVIDDAAQAAGERPRVEDRVLRYASTLGGESLLEPRVASSWVVEADGNARVSVTVTGRVVSLVPGLALTTTQQAFGEVERFERAEL
ncbi:TadE-like protein [Kineococcus xinjiangensis]|uniref:TadE-like protein n=1 Tax=Kineococcus xinjiangensis TaxID=512762 RepID=A0A2S6IWN5_9ACTN|nr:TadE-like protein [Kineococcus xinjiangensis]